MAIVTKAGLALSMAVWLTACSTPSADVGRDHTPGGIVENLHAKEMMGQEAIASVAAVTSEGLTLRLYVEPDPIDEVNNTWAAEISFMLQNAKGELTPATRDIPIVLTSGFGRISPKQILLRAGKATTGATPVRLIAARPGEDRIRAISTIGSIESVVRYRPSFPTAVALNVSPAQSISDGRSQSTLSVRLVDAHKHAQRAEEDVEVYLAANLGKLKADTIVITKGTTTATTTITSTDRGIATISADAAGLEGGIGT